MRVGFSEIVLDREPRACPRCRRRKSGVTELQLLGRLHPAHERFDRRPILRQQCIDVRTREHLFRMSCSETIEVLMQVHDQAMQTVAIAVGGKPRQSGDPPSQHLAVDRDLGVMFLDQIRLRPAGASLGDLVYTLGLGPQEKVTLTQTTSSNKTTSLDDHDRRHARDEHRIRQ